MSDGKRFVFLSDCQRGFISGVCAVIGLSAFVNSDLVAASFFWFIMLVIV